MRFIAFIVVLIILGGALYKIITLFSNSKTSENKNLKQEVSDLKNEVEKLKREQKYK